MRKSTGLALALLVSLAAAPTAFAQPIVQGQASVAPVRQPMRYILANGTILIGTEVGGDAEWMTIQTPNGTMQVRRAEISSMDYQVGQGGVAIVAPNQPPNAVYVMQPAPRRRGRGLVIAGSIVFGIPYGLSALIGIAAAHESPSALWFVLPVAGPLIWANTTSCNGDLEESCRAATYTFGSFMAILEGAGMAMFIIGLSMGSNDDAPPQAEGGLQLAGHPIEISPVVSAGYQGLSLSSTF